MSKFYDEMNVDLEKEINETMNLLEQLRIKNETKEYRNFVSNLQIVVMSFIKNLREVKIFNLIY